MNLRKSRFAIFILLLGVWGCSKEPNQKIGFGQLHTVEQDFDFATERTLPLAVEVPQNWGKEKIRCEIYDSELGQNAKLYFSSFLSPSGQLNGALTLASNVDEVYVKLTYPDGSAQGQWVNSESAVVARFKSHLGNGNLTQDIDYDGVKDPADFYPENAEASAHVHFPKDSDFATVAFEGSWPYTSDFDFNDYVVKYRHQFVLNSLNAVTAIRITSELKMSDQKHGFAFHLPIESERIESVSSSSTTGVELSPNGTERGMGNAVIHVFGRDARLAKQVEIFVELEQAIDLGEITDYSLDPFIYRLADRSHETHTKGGLPTHSAAMDWLSSGEDRSAKGLNYQNANGLPWALNICAASWTAPGEGIDILEFYPRLENWVRSGGQSHEDWYE